MQFPAMFRIRRSLPRPRLDNPAGAARRGVKRLLEHRTLPPGAPVAITAGSRGIDALPGVLRAAVEALREAGCQPFLFAAMGSHGGGTPDGQLEVLAHLGITEDTMEAPVRSDPGLVKAGCTPSGITVWCDRLAWNASAILVVNRVKTHTSCRGPLQSGLFKMMAVGLGKDPGAAAVHHHQGGMGEAILEMGRLMLQTGRILGGLALVENGFGELCRVEALGPAEMEEGEKRLLEEASALHPHLPVEDLDLLLVEEMGKHLSGTGMDATVIGRWRIIGEPELPSPRIGRVAVFDMGEASGGNATGIGLADLVTRRLVEKVDWDKTYRNVMASGYVQRAAIPVTGDTDRTVVEMALSSLNLPDISRARIIRIADTRHLEEMWVSEAVLEEIRYHPGITILEGPSPLAFDSSGTLTGPA